VTVRGVSKVRRRVNVQRRALEGGDASIGDTGIAQILVAGCDPGAATGRERDGGIDRPALQIHKISEAVGVLEDSVQANCDRVRQRLIEIRRQPPVPIAAHLHVAAAERPEPGLLDHAIDHAATAAAAKNHRVRSLQRLDPLQVVEVTVVLHVIPYAIDEKIGRRAVAPYDDLVAIVLTLVIGDPRHVADDVADACHQLILHQLLGHDGDRLRHIVERGRRLGGAADRGGLVTRTHADADVLLHTRKFEHNPHCVGSLVDLANRVVESRSRDRHPVSALIEQQRERTGLVGRDGRRRTAGVRRGGDHGPGERCAGGIDNRAANDESGGRNLGGCRGGNRDRGEAHEQNETEPAHRAITPGSFAPTPPTFVELRSRTSPRASVDGSAETTFDRARRVLTHSTGRSVF